MFCRPYLRIRQCQPVGVPAPPLLIRDTRYGQIRSWIRYGEIFTSNFFQKLARPDSLSRKSSDVDLSGEASWAATACGVAILLLGPSSPHQSRLQQLRRDGRGGPRFIKGATGEGLLSPTSPWCAWNVVATSSTNHLLGTCKKYTSTDQAFRAVRKQLPRVQQQQLAKAAAAICE